MSIVLSACFSRRWGSKWCLKPPVPMRRIWRLSKRAICRFTFVCSAGMALPLPIWEWSTSKRRSSPWAGTLSTGPRMGSHRSWTLATRCWRTNGITIPSSGTFENIWRARCGNTSYWQSAWPFSCAAFTRLTDRRSFMHSRHSLSVKSYITLSIQYLSLCFLSLSLSERHALSLFIFKSFTFSLDRNHDWTCTHHDRTQKRFHGVFQHFQKLRETVQK